MIASGSGSNCHAYWPLTEPLAAGEIERANRRLAHALGADPASADAARILRVPGDATRTSTSRRCRSRRCGSTSTGACRPPTSSAALPDPPRAAARRARRRRTPSAAMTRCWRSRPTSTCARLLGVEVPRHRKVRCPFHPDRHASLHVYETAERGWYCYGRCRRGGTIYDLAAPLYGYAARGEDFLRLRAELRRLFGLEAA